MTHHAYLRTGDIEAGVAAALRFAEEMLGNTEGNPNLTILRYGLLSVEDARTIEDVVMRAPVSGDKKVIVISATRFFHEAQNALLKLFEEPPAGTHIVLVLPTEGIVLPTLRSRLLPLPGEGKTKDAPIVEEFLQSAAREKVVAKLLEQVKSEKEEEKAAARQDALLLIEGLMRRGHELHRKAPDEELRMFLSDLDRFLPMLHDRAAPLKLIFEHILLVLPRGLTK